MKSKVLLILVTISLIISILINVNLFMTMTKKETVFINVVKPRINSLEIVLIDLLEKNIKGYENLSYKINELSRELVLLDQVLFDGSYFLNEDIGYFGRTYDISYVTMALDGRLKVKGYQGSFQEDGILSENEIIFLQLLYDDIVDLNGFNIGNDEKTLSNSEAIYYLERKLNTFYLKWDLAGVRTDTGVSPYDILLLEGQ